MQSEDVTNNQIILIIISKIGYNEKITEVVKVLNDNFQKICYVALNKPYNTLMNDIKQKNMDISKFYFIDVLTSTVTTPPEVDNCTFVESPNALTDLSISFAEAMEKKSCETALFDAISSLIIHEPATTIIKLSQNIMTRLRVEGKKAVFITLREDSEEFVKDLMMFVDKVIEL